MFLFFFSFRLCKNFSCFLQQKASNYNGPGDKPLCLGPGRLGAQRRSGVGGRAHLYCTKVGVTPQSRWKGGGDDVGSGSFACLLVSY